MALQLAAQLSARSVSLDNDEDLLHATEDPGSFLGRLGVPAIIDEVQRGGDRLVLAIEQRLDGSPARGQYVLTGSSNFLTTAMLSESLAGRIDLITVWPLSHGELAAGTDGLVERAFSDIRLLLDHDGATPVRDDYLRNACAGGYPEPPHLAGSPRSRWFERYLETVLRREVATAADLRRFDGLQRLARLVLARSGTEYIASRLAADVGVDRATIDSYTPWLETAFLVHRLPGWSRNISTRTVRRPKIYACDTALAAAVMGKDAAALSRSTDPTVGSLIESFVVAELAKQLTWSDVSAPTSLPAWSCTPVNAAIGWATA